KLALRTVLCSSHADLERFELAFEAVFGDGHPAIDESRLSELGAIEKAALPRAGIPSENETHSHQEADAEPPVITPAAYSSIELLRHKDFANYSDAEMAQARELIARLARRGPRRVSRRRRPSRRRSH